MDQLKIYIDRLKNGESLKIEEVLSPDFLEIHEDDLVFKDPVRLTGEAYLSNDHLIIHLNIDTTALLPCNICNTPVQIPISVKNIYLTQPLEEIKGAIYDVGNEVRESILIQTPLFAECRNGNCPERENLKNFLNSDHPNSSKDKDIVHFPFSDLDK
jgi:uncharacterized metal-binding protein YceD (DUF177 family)